MTRYLIGDNPSGEEKVKGLAILEPLEPGYVTPISRQGGGTTLPPEKELEFRAWYRKWSERLGLNPDPDDPRHLYDYRAAFLSNAEPDETGHWPSQFKLEGHPRMNVEGINTKTGQRVPDYKPSEMLRDQMDILKTIMNETKGKINQPPKTPEVLPSRQEGGPTSPSTVQPFDWGKGMMDLYKTIVSAVKSQTRPQPPPEGWGPMKTGQGLSQRTSGYGSFPFGSETSQQAESLFKGPSLPNPTKSITPESPSMTAEIANPPTDLYAKLKEQFGPYGHGPIKSAAVGAVTVPDPYDEEERRKLMEMTQRMQTQPATEVTPPPKEDELDKLRRLMTVGKEQFPGAEKMAREAAGQPVVPSPEYLELESRRRWEGMPSEDRLNLARAGWTPGYQRSYYEARPGEEAEDVEWERKKELLKPIYDALEREKMREQGFGLGMHGVGPIGVETRLARGRMGEGREHIPGLIPGLATIAAIKGTPLISQVAKTTQVAPHTDEDRYSYTLYNKPYRNLSEGEREIVDERIKLAKPQTEPSEWRAFYDAGVEKGWSKDKILAEWQKRQAQTRADLPTEAVRTFEAITGAKPENRGSAEYQSTYHKFLEDQKMDRSFIPPDTLDRLSSARTVYGTMTDVVKRLEDPRIRSQFGPISGRWAKLKVAFAKDPESSVVQRELNSLITMAYALSGKQISYREMEILREALMPHLNQPYENFEAALKFSMDWVRRGYNDALTTYSEAGWRTRSLQPLPEVQIEAPIPPPDRSRRDKKFNEY